MLWLLSFASSTRLRRKRRTWTIDENYFYEHRTHTSSNYIKFLIGVIFHGDLHFDDETESENWNFLKYGMVE